MTADRLWYGGVTVWWYGGVTVWQYDGKTVWRYGGTTVWWYGGVTVSGGVEVFGLTPTRAFTMIYVVGRANLTRERQNIPTYQGDHLVMCEMNLLFILL